MTDYLSNLPVEIIHKIYDNIPSFDILGCLCLTNKRLRLISFTYPRFRLNFSCLKKKRHFDLFCAQLHSISSDTISLEFSNIDDGTIPAKIDCFFLQYNNINYTFPKLHSLSFSHVDSTIWMSITNHLKSLTSLISLSIYTANMSYRRDVNDFTLYLLKDLLFISSTLKYLCLRIHSDSAAFINQLDVLEKVSSIKHLILDNIFVDVESLSLVAPALNTLDMIINYCNLNISKHVYPFEHLKSLSITIYSHNFSSIKQLVYSMVQLIDLTIVGYNVHKDMTNGIAWEEILTNILTFKFIFTFYKSTSISEPIELDSFRSLFWLEKKRWYIGYDRCAVGGVSLLYSIPYFIKTFPWFYNQETIITTSTGPHITSFSSIDRLIVNDQSTINNTLLHRYTNLKILDVKELNESFSLLFNDIIPFIDISRITTFLINNCRSQINDNILVKVMRSMSQLYCIRIPLTLLKLTFAYCWPNIKRLEIPCSCSTINIIDKELMNNEINAFYHSFSHLEYLSIFYDIDLNICQLLNNKPITISNIMINHPINGDPTNIDNFITHDWLEKNTYLRNFSYSYNQLNTVSLWF